ncbi:hypothetical protein LTR91_012131 [Friedmanniomyces endolithicus]|uniref:Methyltransferase domain-containing protein n=1 Tax=Friedmanniomyces endolithicus TaxID=329885 RepID=A0AAN6FWN4_9PEZI|nr:hypothetical protein LTR35_002394 [Friedmanniomyces endolithicus]KAK0295844.1 hypothetical protein LTS00_005585 [Friedmanniomyces endolithicus]KAK0325815.1 hypothetical protein LTR82_003353 [Friedmanniomyces endolithicus]KAK0916190.1 hypothetical protein LTR57_013082 [Friedmanniomyces endolithicus]KAK0980740.1 hypothetical protein LTR91_012131 [Friedmanniomyces endolithicus]
MAQVPQPLDDRRRTFGGRRFSLFSLETNTYCVPVDEAEEERCDELHKIIRQICGNHIVLVPPGQFPPPGVDEPLVLDCGFGNGAWIDDLLGVREYEDCKVVGVDIYLGSRDDDEDDDDDDDEEENDGLQEFEKKRWNLNAPFRTDTSTSRLRREQFDLINSRFLAEGISTDRWSSYVRELKELLKPGGWLQMVELELVFQSDNGRLAPRPSEPLFVWSEWYRHTMEQCNKNPRIGRSLGQLLRTEGFDNVLSGSRRLEIGMWNSGPGFPDTGVRANMSKTIETLLLWPCAGALAGHRAPMNPDQYRAMVRGAQIQLQDESLRLYCQVYVAPVDAAVLSLTMQQVYCIRTQAAG